MLEEMKRYTLKTGDGVKDVARVGAVSGFGVRGAGELICGCRDASRSLGHLSEKDKEFWVPAGGPESEICR